MGVRFFETAEHLAALVADKERRGIPREPIATRSGAINPGIVRHLRLSERTVEPDVALWALGGVWKLKMPLVSAELRGR